MNNAWSHPTFGKFEDDGGLWRCELHEIDLDRFRYIDLLGEESDTVGVTVEQRSLDEVEPVADATQTLDDFWSRRDIVPKMVLDRLWNEISGVKKTCNWWGDPSSWPDPPTPGRPESKESLVDCMRLVDISCRFFPAETGEPVLTNPFTGEAIARSAKTAPLPRTEFWAIEITYDASFEEEHGIGFVWHRGRIVGSGYGYGDANPDLEYQPLG